MRLATTDQIAGATIVETKGVARGNTIRAKHIGKDLMAGLRNLVGGEITEYTAMLSEAREEAVARMVADAERQGANAVVSIRFSTSMVMQNAAEILAYGTAVVVEDAGA